MNITFYNDQPGRIIAVTIISPTLLFKGILYNDKFITIFSMLLFFWDLYYLVFTKPNEYIIN